MRADNTGSLFRWAFYTEPLTFFAVREALQNKSTELDFLDLMCPKFVFS